MGFAILFSKAPQGLVGAQKDLAVGEGGGATRSFLHWIGG